MASAPDAHAADSGADRGADGASRAREHAERLRRRHLVLESRLLSTRDRGGRRQRALLAAEEAHEAYERAAEGAARDQDGGRVADEQG